MPTDGQISRHTFTPLQINVIVPSYLRYVGLINIYLHVQLKGIFPFGGGLCPQPKIIIRGRGIFFGIGRLQSEQVPAQRHPRYVCFIAQGAQIREQYKDVHYQYCWNEILHILYRFLQWSFYLQQKFPRLNRKVRVSVLSTTQKQVLMKKKL